MRTLLSVARDKRAHWPAHNGIHGMFVPILKNGICLGVLQTGIFLRAEPTESGLISQWESLVGRKLMPDDGRFLDYVRAVVDTPILDDTLVEGLRELLALFADYLTGTLAASTAASRMEHLQRDLFSRRLWHRRWADWQAIRPTFFRGDVDPKRLLQWEKEELGITRFPTLALATKLEGTGVEWADWIETVGFQRESQSIAKEMGEALAYPLEKFGVLLLTSSRPGLTSAGAAAEILEKIEFYRQRLSKRFSRRVWVGIGRNAVGGVSLHDSYLEATTALHLAVTKNQNTVDFKDAPKADLNEAGLRHKVSAFVNAIFDQARAPEPDHREVFIQDILVVTRERPETIRRVLIETLHQLFSKLEIRRGTEGSALVDLESEVIRRMETARNVSEMIGRFAVAFDQVLSFLDAPNTGDRLLRLQKARDLIRASLHERWTLPMAARKFGFSSITFSREFGRYVGQPFSDFILSQRLEKARLLLDSDLSVKQVAEACGFSSVVYFQQIFKRRTGMPPGQFRKRRMP
jgi:AraC-like DNA-binding protein